MRVYFIVVLLFCAISIQALVDIRLIGLSAATPVLGISALVGLSWAAALWYIFGRSPISSLALENLRHPFWVASIMIAIYIVGCDAIGLVGAWYAGLRVVTGPQYMRIAAVIEAMVSRTALRPKKAW